MDIFTLNSALQRERLIDQYAAFVWTERYFEFGDFVLEFPDTPANRKILSVDSKIAIRDSNRVMQVKTVQRSKADDGQATIKYTGYSLERILDDRITTEFTTSPIVTSDTKMVMTGYPAAILRAMFHAICIDTTLNPDDVLSGVLETNVLYPADTIPEPDESITYEVTPQTLYAAMNNLASIYNLGMRIVRSDTPSSSLLYFNVYTGIDRTSAQTEYPAIVFSEKLGNLSVTSSVTSTALYKNVAYVLSPAGSEIVYAPGIEPPVTNFERQVLLVIADDIGALLAPEVASAKMIQRGREELGRCVPFSAFDGETTEYSTYRYGTDYNLGDLVEHRDSSGASNIMRVTEQIFVSDREGTRSYPTLTLDKYISPGSWASPEYMVPWDSMGETSYWSGA